MSSPFLPACLPVGLLSVRLCHRQEACLSPGSPGQHKEAWGGILRDQQHVAVRLIQPLKASDVLV